MDKVRDTSKSGRTERYEGVKRYLQLAAVPFITCTFTKFTDPIPILVVKGVPDSIREAIENLGYILITDKAYGRSLFTIIPNELAWAHQNVVDFTEGYVEILLMLGGKRTNEEFFKDM